LFDESGKQEIWNKMKINTLAKLTLIGLVYIYTVKLIDTLYHGIFKPVPVTGAIVGLNILSGFVQLIFYKAFTTDDA
jgi:hypothetical protein